MRTSLPVRCGRVSAGKYGAWHDYLQYLHRHGKGARPPPGNDPNVHTKKTQITFLKSLRRCDRKGDVRVRTLHATDGIGASSRMACDIPHIRWIRAAAHGESTRPIACKLPGAKPVCDCWFCGEKAERSRHYTRCRSCWRSRRTSSQRSGARSHPTSRYGTGYTLHASKHCVSISSARGHRVAQGSVP